MANVATDLVLFFKLYKLSFNDFLVLFGGFKLLGQVLDRRVLVIFDSLGLLDIILEDRDLSLQLRILLLELFFRLDCHVSFLLL